MNDVVYLNTKTSAKRLSRRLKIRIFLGIGCSGICSNAVEAGFQNIHLMFVEWDEFSGDSFFPVPSPNVEDPAPLSYGRTFNKWNRFSKYGRSRTRLAKFIIKHIEDNIHKFKDEYEN